MKRRNFIQCFLIAALALLPYAVFSAENGGFQERGENATVQRNVLQENGVNNLRSQPRISRGQAMNIASGRYEGRVLSIRQDNNNWRVRMDRDGTVFNVFVNTTSGAVSASSD